jgi:quaternary ammonium compound-resistance protein SugE
MFCYTLDWFPTPDERAPYLVKKRRRTKSKRIAHLEVVMAWLLLVVAGLLEVAWAVGLKYTEGFTRPVPSVLTGLAIVGSMLLLGIATRTLPIGTAYGVWVGIGAFGAAVLGIVLFGEVASPPRLLFLGLLLVAVIGLKVTSSH